MKNIKIELVSDINEKYPYMEVFYKKNTNPFLDISLNNNKELIFKFYSSKTDLELNIEDIESIFQTSKDYQENEKTSDE